VVGVEQWAEIRRMVLVERRSVREVARLTGLARDTVARAVSAEVPPRYLRAPAGSKLDPFKGWICDQLRGDPSIQSLRLREMASDLGYEGGKSIFDDYVREVRPRFLVPRTFQRTVYRPGELVQCDLWEPREHVPVGHGHLRRGYVVTVEVCWSRVIAGALIFSKEAPDILWGLGRCLGRLGVLPEKLVWDCEGAIHAGGGRPTVELHDMRRVFSSLLDEVNATRAYKDQQMGHKPPGLADAYDRAFKRRRDVGERIDALVQSATVEHQATHQAM